MGGGIHKLGGNTGPLLLADAAVALCANGGVADVGVLGFFRIPLWGGGDIIILGLKPADIGVTADLESLDGEGPWLELGI